MRRKLGVAGVAGWTAAAVLCGVVVNRGVEAMQEAAPVQVLSQPGPTFTVPAAEIPKQWKVIAYGDTRFTDPANTDATNPKARRWLVEKIAEEHPDALLISGDLPYRGAVTGDYEEFRRETAAWRSEKLRVFPALGNHEMNGGEAVGLKNWWAVFPELTGRRWYSVRFGNAYFIALDSDTDLTDGSPQRMWLEDQMKKLPKETQFVMIELHHPPVADTILPQVHPVRINEAALAKYLDGRAGGMKAKVIVVAGHIHNYERFERAGVMYLVSGGGGAKPYEVRRDPEDLYKNAPQVNFHYVRFEFDGKELHATMFRVDAEKDAPVWEARDSFTVAAK